MPKFVHAIKYVTERPVVIQDCDLWINADCIEQMQKDGKELIVIVRDCDGVKYIIEADYISTFNEAIDKMFPEPDFPMGYTSF